MAVKPCILSLKDNNPCIRSLHPSLSKYLSKDLLATKALLKYSNLNPMVHLVNSKDSRLDSLTMVKLPCINSHP